MRCKICQYSLSGLRGPEHRCPECGRAFDPNDPKTFRDDGYKPWHQAALWAIGILLAGLVALLSVATPAALMLIAIVIPLFILLVRETLSGG